MAMPKVLDWLDDLVAQVATNVTDIAKNASDIAANKQLFDTHTADDDRHWTTEDRQNFDRTIHFKGYFISLDKLKEAYPTGQLGDYAIVGGTDTVWLWDDENNTWLNSTEQGIVISVNGRTGEVILTKTDVGLSNVDNTSDVNKPVSTAQQAALNDKVDRKKITVSQADTPSLRAGTYYINNESKTILGVASSYWIIINSEMSQTQSATQIWMNYNSGSNPRMFIRHQELASGSTNIRMWGDFVEVLTTIHLSTLNNTISELQTNIQANATDIDNLKFDKTDRREVTLEEANSMSLRAGTYKVRDENTTILDKTFKHWTVIVGEYELAAGTIVSATQIWMPYDYQERVDDIIPQMYIRRAISDTEWSEFVEVITSAHMSDEDIARFKQYKGFYEDLVALRTAHATATAGDYAIVGSVLYIWNDTANTWVEISGGGGGGSTGTGKWSVKKFNISTYTTQRTPKFKDIVGKILEEQWEIYDTADYFINTKVEDYKTYLFETYVNMNEATEITTTTMLNDDGVGVYLNNQMVYEKKGVNSTSEMATVTLSLKKGWNKIQIILIELAGGEYFRLGTKITDNVNCLMMDCYHAENDLIQGYVPLVGDSTIEGNLTVEGTVGVTSNSYLQYNEEDNSISFMFNN